ncbi:MAG: DNA repair protein RecO [Bacillota bacterium]
MSLYRTEGFVIKSADFDESDKLITVFTVDYGKLRLLARGARKPRSRLAAACQQFNLVKFLAFQGRGLDVVSQAETRNAFPVLKGRLDLLAYANCFAELVDTFCGECYPDVTVYSALGSALAMLESGVDPEIVLIWFGLISLGAAGYGPQLEKCALCGKPLVAPCFVRPDAGGVVCSSCAGGDLEIGSGVLELLRKVQKCSAKGLRAVQTNHETKMVAGQVVRKMLFWFMERQPKCFEFLEASI